MFYIINSLQKKSQHHIKRPYTTITTPQHTTLQSHHNTTLHNPTKPQNYHLRGDRNTKVGHVIDGIPLLWRYRGVLQQLLQVLLCYACGWVVGG